VWEPEVRQFSFKLSVTYCNINVILEVLQELIKFLCIMYFHMYIYFFIIDFVLQIHARWYLWFIFFAIRIILFTQSSGVGYFLTSDCQLLSSLLIKPRRHCLCVRAYRRLYSSDSYTRQPCLKDRGIRLQKRSLYDNHLAMVLRVSLLFNMWHVRWKPEYE
jgi:hypothetical protein